MQFANYILNAVGLTYIFWLLFVMCMGFYSAWPKMPLIAKCLASPAVLFAAVFDVAWNYTLGSVMFLELPPNRAYTFTKRISNYLLEQSWRQRVAQFICSHFLDVFQAGGHCGR